MNKASLGEPRTRLSADTRAVEVTTGSYEGIDAVIAEDAATRLVLLPSIGAKVVPDEVARRGGEGRVQADIV